ATSESPRAVAVGQVRKAGPVKVSANSAHPIVVAVLPLIFSVFLQLLRLACVSAFFVFFCCYFSFLLFIDLLQLSTLHILFFRPLCRPRHVVRFGIGGLVLRLLPCFELALGRHCGLLFYLPWPCCACSLFEVEIRSFLI